MGSSTKKHKKDKDKEKDKDRERDKDKDKESRKRKHKERDRESDSEERDRDRRHKREKRKEKKRERGREKCKDSDSNTDSPKRRSVSPDVQEVPVDSHLKSSSANRSSSKCVEMENPVSASNTEVLSIEETNRLRAKLGLKPLQVEDEIADDGKIKDDLGEFYHKPAENISSKKFEDKLRSKISERKEKRALENKLLNVKALGESDDESENDTAAWVNRNREIIKQKEEAAKRAAILDELDAEFGVGEIAAEDEILSRQSAYTSNSLLGLKVQHNVDAFSEGREIILTLEDKEVLNEDADVLVNVNLKDDERYIKSNENKKKAISGYNPYEHADDIDQYGMPIDKNILSKYDEEIKGSKKPDGFVLGDEDGLEARKFKQMMIREKLSSKRVESLVLPELKIASEYYTEDEMKAKFKKPRKKGKIRSKPKLENIDSEKSNLLVTDDTDVVPNNIISSLKLDIEEDENDTELELALAKARRLKLAEQQKLKLPKVEDLIATIKTEDEDEPSAGRIVLDSTAEFCRTLGDIPTYGQAGNRDVDVAELMDIEKYEQCEKDVKTESAWNSVDVDMEQFSDSTKDAGGALAAEPALGSGLSGALKLALSKGYLEKGREVRATPPSLPHLQANHYSIDDKAHAEDDKFNRRERGYSGPISEFREKEGFRPNVKLDYVDDEGRHLKPKEAFRYLSHKFHGKGPGKNKQEKRIKQSVQENLMKKMSSNDTPLGTLSLLQARQKEAKAAFVVLSGSKAPRNVPL